MTARRSVPGLDVASHEAARALISLLSTVLPWRLRRAVLTRLLGYDLHPSARIGFAWVFPGHLMMDAGARIGALTVCRGVEQLQLEAGASIGPANWITGMPRGAPGHYADELDRRSDLLIGRGAVVGSRNYIDCTNVVSIGSFTRIDGLRSVVLSHSIDLVANRQRSKPVSIGSHCLIGSNCVFLPGSSTADFCVIEAASLVAGELRQPHTFYAGSPARSVAEFPADSAFGSRGRRARAADDASE